MSENQNKKPESNKLDTLMKATYVMTAITVIGTGLIGFKLWKLDSPAPEIIKKLF